MGLPRSTYYDEPAAPPDDTAIVEAIAAICDEFETYGYRRVGAALRQAGMMVNHKKIRRLMREHDLQPRMRRRFVATTDSDHDGPIFPNRAADLVVDGPNQLWVADITYVRLPTAFVYLACILDAWSRRCVGWHLSRSIDTRLTLAALDHALVTRRPAPGLIHHSDRGVRYASGDYVARLEEAGARISMAAVGNPYENAKAESFFRTLKMEEVYIKEDYRDFEEAEQNIGGFIEEVYNKKRLHSSLGYLPPVEFEAQHALKVRS